MSTARIAFLSAHISGSVKLDYLVRRGCRPAAVIALDANAAARHGVAGYVDPGDAAQRHGIPIRYVTDFSMKAADDLAYFTESSFDLLVISGWQRLVPAEILTTFRCGAIAEHGSAEYLPKGRGRSPVGWALATGQRRFVLHLFRAEPNVDGGPILDYCALELNPFDDINSVYCKIGIASGQLLLKHIDAILSDRAVFHPQRDEAPSFTRRRTVDDDFIDWRATTAQIHDLIRATTLPYPVAKARLNGQQMLVRDAVPFDRFLDFYRDAVGEIIAVFPDRSFAVKTVDGSLLVRGYEYEGEVKCGDIFEEKTKVS